MCSEQISPGPVQGTHKHRPGDMDSKNGRADTVQRGGGARCEDLDLLRTKDNGPSLSTLEELS